MNSSTCPCMSNVTLLRMHAHLHTHIVFGVVETQCYTVGNRQMYLEHTHDRLNRKLDVLDM